MTGKSKYLIYLLGIIPCVWLGLLVAPTIDGGLIQIISDFSDIISHPFRIRLCKDSLTTVLVLIAAYGMGIGIYLSTKRNYRRGEEHGSAKWGDATEVNKKYKAKENEPNKVFTQNVAMGLNGKKHRRNLNTVVVGGSGAGKTRFYAKPNLYEVYRIVKSNGTPSSFVCLDPKGELLRDSGNLLIESGYDVRVLDLINMPKSHCYNPYKPIQEHNP